MTEEEGGLEALINAEWAIIEDAKKQLDQAKGHEQRLQQIYVILDHAKVLNKLLARLDEAEKDLEMKKELARLLSGIPRKYRGRGGSYKIANQSMR